jgi:branched-chain amino acid transport system ATP-binding protein
VLELDRVSAHYGNLQVLREVSLEVPAGAITALLGGNGSGKSTTLRAIVPIGPRVTGRISLEGRAITGLRPDRVVALGLALVPQGREVFPRMTVDEHLEMGAFRRHDRAGIRADAERMFALFPRLRERRRQPAGTLSGGEQQMLALARGLMTRPRLLLLDEPSAGLAPRIVDLIYDVIQSLNREGLTVLLVEQNVQLALEVAATAYVLRHGRIVLAGPAAAVAQSAELGLSFLGGTREDAAGRLPPAGAEHGGAGACQGAAPPGQGGPS